MNFLFIELLHKIRITFVIMLILEVKNGTLCIILTNFLSVVFISITVWGVCQRENETT